jgi:hypothetical protein
LSQAAISEDVDGLEVGAIETKTLRKLMNAGWVGKGYRKVRFVNDADEKAQPGAPRPLKYKFLTRGP